MKYAIIVLITLYLIIYGCSPDNSEKSTENQEHQEHQEQTVPAAEQQPAKSEMVAVPAEQPEPVVAQEQPAVVEEAVEAKPTEQSHPAEAAQQPAAAAESEQVVMPCGRVMARADIPENAPCLKMQPPALPESADPADSAPMADQSQELTAALQKMVETTHELMLVTRQLVIATQKMLDAGKEVADQVTGTSKETIDAPEAQPPVEQPVEGRQPGASLEKDVVETMQEVASAAREVIETTGNALSTSLEAKQQ